MEDLDRPRVVAGAADRILHALTAFGFEWDGPVTWQSERSERYADALDAMRAMGSTFECSCSRAQQRAQGEDDARYDGACRRGPLRPGEPTAVRLRVEPAMITFSDRIQGAFRQDVADAVGDVVLRRRDGVVAYLLAAVVDDAAQGVTHVLRGADLLDNTPRQIYLQRALRIPTPRYAHVPVLTEPDGSKLSKSARSACVDAGKAAAQLVDAFRWLGMQPPAELGRARPADAWEWAIREWRVDAVPRRLALPITG